jgi:glycosyltransferase involved in cell wall biosynthesis
MAYENRGIGYHLKAISGALPVIAPEISFKYIFRDERAASLYTPQLPNVESHIMQPVSKRIWLEDQIRLPFFSIKHKIKVWHCPVALGPLHGINIPVLSPCPVVATIHDLHVEKLPDPQMSAYSRERRYQLQRFFIKNCHIVAVSEATRKSLEAGGIVSRKGTHVIPNCFRKGEYENAALSRKEKLILFIGDSAHKNVNGAITVFRSLAARHPDWRFVMVGAQQRIAAMVTGGPQSLSAMNTLQITENISEEEMQQLYQKASILFMPSLSEGFGIPVIQAFANSAVPVVSARSALPEAGGSAALYVNPMSVQDMADGLDSLMKDPAKLSLLAHKGRERAKQFTPEYQLPKLVAHYRKAASLV